MRHRPTFLRGSYYLVSGIEGTLTCAKESIHETVLVGLLGEKAFTFYKP
jgi:hypothetical protein